MWKTYPHANTDKSKNYNVMNQVLDCMNILGSGKPVVLDSEYVTKILFEDAKAVWNLRIIGPLRPNTAHLPCNFSALKSRASRWIRGHLKLFGVGL